MTLDKSVIDVYKAIIKDKPHNMQRTDEEKQFVREVKLRLALLRGRHE